MRERTQSSIIKTLGKFNKEGKKCGTQILQNALKNYILSMVLFEFSDL